jgi:hypothetical protein
MKVWAQGLFCRLGDSDRERERGGKEGGGGGGGDTATLKRHLSEPDTDNYIVHHATTINKSVELSVGPYLQSLLSK